MRTGMNVLIAVLAGVIVPAIPPFAAPGNPPTTRPAADTALAWLKQGNIRFATGRCEHPNTDAARLANTSANGQHPFATVVYCSDSRVPAERIFDVGIGDIFGVRVAGNVCNTDEVGSIEYGVEHLGTPLLVILGHTQCGAVTAVATGEELHGNIPPLVSAIRNAVATAQRAHPGVHGKDLIPAAIRENVWQAIDDLMRTSPATRKLVAGGRLKVVGALYNVENGKIEWLGPHPEEKRLLAYCTGPVHGIAATSPVQAAEEPADRAKHDESSRGAAGSSAVPRPNAEARHDSANPPAQPPQATARIASVLSAHAYTPAEAARATDSSAPDARAKSPVRPAATAVEGNRDPPHSVRTASNSGVSYSLWGVVYGLILAAGTAAFVGGRSNMFKSMKLGTKIGVGFGALLVIMLFLGGIAVWNMWGVKTIANTLANASVPAVGIANEVERASLHTMYEARGFAFTEEKNYLDRARPHLEKVKKDLKDAKEHAAKFSIAVLKQNAEAAEAKALEYEQLLNETVARTEAMAKDKAASLEAADTYMKTCYAYLDRKTKQQQEALKKGAADEKSRVELVQLARETGLVNDVIDLGNAIRIGTWQAIATRDPKLFQETAKKFEDVNKKLDEIKAGTTDPEDLKQVEECRAAGTAYLGCMNSFLANWFAREELNKKRTEVGNAVLDAAKNTAVAGMDDAVKGTGQAASSLSTASITVIVGLSAALVLGIVLALFITRSITKPINRIIESLTAGAEQTSAAAEQVSAASQSLAQGASEQAAAIEETSSSLEEMSSMTKQNAANAQQANSLMAEAGQLVSRGQESMGRLTAAIEEIKKSSDETAKIVKTIDEIAFQTNLLALNAAVEAARAGDAGKGFAVVAEEVRNLAQRAGEAARNTATMIEDSVKNADNGVAVASETAKALEAVSASAQKVSGLVSEIAAASNEQAQGIAQVNTAVGQMDQVTQQAAANAEESASASEELSAQAQQLQGMVQELLALVQGGSAIATAGGAQTSRAKSSNHAAGTATRPATGTRPKTKTPQRPTVTPTDELIHRDLIGSAGEKAARPHAPKPKDVIPLDNEEELAKF